MIKKLIIYPTLRCNIKCNYCFYRNNYSHKLSLENFKKAFNKFIAITQNPSVVFLGGEPFIIFKKIKRMINYIKKINDNIPITIFSNGTFLNKEISNFIKKNNIKLVISIDGDKETNDKFRNFVNNKSVYDYVINRIKKYNLEELSTLNMVVRKESISKLSENIKKLYNEGLRSIGWNIDYSDNWNEKDIKLIKIELKKVFNHYLKLLKENKEIYEISNRYEIIEYLKNKTKPECGNLILMPDGKFILCDKLINSGFEEYFILPQNDIEKYRTNIFKKYQEYKTANLFCKFGVFIYYRYHKKLTGKMLENKIKTIFKIQNAIIENTLRQFRFLMKFKSFKEKHKI